MAKEKILVVDDEPDILELIRYNLAKEGYQVTCVPTGEAAIRKVRETKPDLVVLDLMLPGTDGLQVCREFKTGTETRHIPILILTAKAEDADIVLGLELGADDYVTKPFSPRVLLARVRAVLRRNKPEDNKNLTITRFDDLIIDRSRHEVLVAGKPVDLTASEFSILQYLARRPGWVFTREQIISAIRGDDYAVTERSVDVQIVGLRKKLGPIGARIETVRGVGYRFKE
jgi:two-component system, OmpR family, alkaline phosphatase synthesis response regulator PhoP